MKIFIITLFVFLNVSPICAQFGYAPPGSIWSSYVLNYQPERWTDWSNAGRQGGIPSTFSCNVNINDAKYTGTFTQKLMTAIEDAHNFGVDHNTIVAVKIPAGNFMITQTIDLPSNVLIKGTGSNQTTITFQTGNSLNNCFTIFGGYDEINYKVVQSGGTMGSTSVSLDNVTNLNENDFIDIKDSRSIAWENGDPVPYSIGQVVQIQSINGNQLILKDKLTLDHSGFTTRVHKLTPKQNVGIEDIHIARSLDDGAGNGVTILFWYAANCWVKGCELSNASSMHIRTQTSSHITIKGNFIHHAQDYGDNGRGYGVALYYRSTNCLVEDNLLNYLRHALLLSTSSNRNVISNNYCWDRYATGNFLGNMNTVGDLSFHGNYAHRNLIESNSIENLFADDNYGDVRGYSNTLLTGNGPYNTFLRNDIRVEQISLHACDYATVIGSNAVIDDASWYIPLVVDYRGSVGTDGFYTEWIENCTNQTFITYGTFLERYAWVHTDDFFPDISYYLTEQKMKDLFSTTSWPNYDGAVYGPTYGSFAVSTCTRWDWHEPRKSPAEYRKDQTKKTLNGGTVGSTNINNPINVYLKQLDNNDDTFGQASYWDSDQWSDTPPTEQVALDYQRQHFLAIQDFKPGSYEKFSYWQELPNNDYRYRNWDTLSLQPNSLQVIAKFKPTTNAVIKNEFTEITGLNPTDDVIQFKDPWYLNVNEQPFGLRSSGLDAQPLSNSSPFNLSQSSDYKGVFLNQGGTGFTPPYYSVKVDQQTLNVTLNTTGVPSGHNHKFYFQNWGGSEVQYQDANALETGVVFTDNDPFLSPIARANFKGTQLTSNSNAYATGQRKVINLNNRLYNTYDSMGKVFLESSSDNGQTWRIDNNGMPLNTGSGARCPAITSAYSGSSNCVITFQELIPNTTSSKVKVVSYYWEPQQLNIIGEFVIENSSSISLNPITTIGFDYTVVTTYEKNGTLESRFGFWYLGTYPHITISWSNYSIALFENNYSEFTQETGMEGSLTKYHLIARKNVAYNRSDIVYKKFKVQRGTTGGFDPNNPNDAWLINEIIESNVSNKSGGSEMNIRPSISLANNYPVVSWITGYYSYNDITSSRVLTRRGPIWGATNSNGYQAKFVTNNSASSSTEKSVIVYSENGGNSITKWIKRTGTSFTTPQTLSHLGNQTNLTSGNDYQYMSAMVFNSTSLPYYFIKSTTDFSTLEEEGGGGLNKISVDDTIVTFGRRGVASINDIEFVFEIGDILVGDSIIRFIEIPDTISYSSANELNEHTRTSNFTLTPSTNLYFSNIYYVVTKSNPDTALTTTDAVNFKAELVNASTNQVVGTFDNITYNKNNLEKHANIDYEVDCSGITSGEYFLRLVTSVNTDAAYGLANIVSDNTTLAKKNFNKVNFTGSEIPITYELSNNFPNPFNPSTTIRYQIPQDGIVTLKIYDILGSEVATLVNEEKPAGKYEVNFNASTLASGVYIYKIQAGSFINSKKMILLK